MEGPTNQEGNRIEKATVLEALRTRGMTDPEVLAMVERWVTQGEQEAHRDGTRRAGLLFEMERTDLYVAAGDTETAREYLEDILMQAEQEGLDDLVPAIREKIASLG